MATKMLWVGQLVCLSVLTVSIAGGAAATPEQNSAPAGRSRTARSSQADSKPVLNYYVPQASGSGIVKKKSPVEAAVARPEIPASPRYTSNYQVSYHGIPTLQGTGESSQGGWLNGNRQTYYPGQTFYANVGPTAGNTQAPIATQAPAQAKRFSFGGLFRSSSPESQSQKVSFQSTGRVETGTASWYGPDFHGGKTANGETYDMNSMTAAHRTLPFGTILKVTNLNNGREALVRVNNRGPYLRSRVVDLSKAAAAELGFMGRGLAKVRLEVVKMMGQ